VQRKAYGRDLGLTLRMAFVGLVLATLYAGVLLLAVLVVLVDPGEWESWAIAAIMLGAVGGHLAAADRLVLRAVRARLVSPDEEPDLHAAIERLCALADLPKPRVAVSDLTVPNAFATGITPSRGVIVVTRGLRARLDRGQLEAVLAHELSHIANRDAVLVTAASLFPTVGAWLGRWRFGGRDFRDRKRDRREYVLWPFMIVLGAVLYGFGALLTFTISRYREYAADRGAALITGAPEQLMSALQTISSDMALIPTRDLRALAGLNAFFIIPTTSRRRRLELLMTHPPVEKRLAELGEIARELGKAGA
jgi:heat shock protein HtpX